MGTGSEREGRCGGAGGEESAGPRRPVSSAHRSVCLQSTAGGHWRAAGGHGTLQSKSFWAGRERASYRTREDAVFKQEVWWLGQGSGGGGGER